MFYILNVMQKYRQKPQKTFKKSRFWFWKSLEKVAYYYLKSLEKDVYFNCRWWNVCWNEKWQTGIITKQYNEGEVIKLPQPQREGYTFEYWKGSEYKAGDEYTVKEDHTFVAVWKKAVKKPVNTGDTNHSQIWRMLMMASLGMFITLAVIRRRLQSR